MTIVIDGTNGISGVDGTASNPSYEGTDSNTGIFFPAADTVAIGTGGTERLRVVSAWDVGVGTSSPATISNRTVLSINNASNGGALNLLVNGTETLRLLTDNSSLGYVYNIANQPLVFGTNNTERARIDSSGNFLVTKTSVGLQNVGVQLEALGTMAATRGGGVTGIFNRRLNDGDLVWFQQDDVNEGTISVSGTTVSYNGGHLARYSQLLSGQRDEAIVKGTVLSNLDEMCEWLDAEGNPLPNEQLNRMKVSDVEGDTNVAGVFVNWDNDDQDNPYDMNIAMTGDMIIRIAQGVTVQKGDLLMSAGDGTAKPQGDDIVRSKTVAKVTSNHVTCTYDDGSYCVPCVLMAC